MLIPCILMLGLKYGRKRLVLYIGKTSRFLLKVSDFFSKYGIAVIVMTY